MRPAAPSDAGTPEVVQAEESLRVFADHLRTTLRRLAGSTDCVLDQPSYSVLVHIECAGPCRQADLASALGVDASTMSRRISHLEGMGAVHRDFDATDRRAHRITTTPRGARLLADERGRRQRALRTVIGTWSARDRSDLIAVLARLNDSLQSLPHPQTTSDVPEGTS